MLVAPDGRDRAKGAGLTILGDVAQGTGPVAYEGRVPIGPDMDAGELYAALRGALARAKGDRYLGILNGIDPDVWNPATDEALAVPTAAAALLALRQQQVIAEETGGGAATTQDDAGRFLRALASELGVAPNCVASTVSAPMRSRTTPYLA